MSEVNALSLLALKVAPNVFDISSGQYHVSIRDQIVRGQLLIRDLCALDPEFKHVLVVGAGVGGAAVAAAAASAGKVVRVVDSAEMPFALQFGKHARFVGPFMYEWPSSTHSKQTYPPAAGVLWGQPSPATPSWNASSPISAHQLAVQLTVWLKSQLNQNPRRLQCWCEVPSERVISYVSQFAQATVKRGHISPLRIQGKRWPQGQRKSADFLPDYVVLAAGMGTEDVALEGSVQGPRFWDNDDLLDSATAGRNVGIFGGGDGALQDVIRALTGCAEPLIMLERLQANPAVKTAIDARTDALSVIEAQGRLYGSWTLGLEAFRVLDASCRDIAKSLAVDPSVAKAVVGCIRDRKGRRTGRVTQVVREAFFTKAYLLNRFLVHLINEVKLNGSLPPSKMQYELLLGRKVTASTGPAPHGSYNVTFNRVMKQGFHERGRTMRFDRVAVRFGMKASSKASSAEFPRGMQMIQLTEGESGQRTSLAHVPVPFVMTR